MRLGTNAIITYLLTIFNNKAAIVLAALFN
jgi:hypothetical protein